MDIRTEYNSGKLLFRWEPTSNVVSIACKDTVYDVKLLHEQKGDTYEVIRKREKPKSKEKCQRTSK